jgi:CheY-like chemotaxis protein
MSVILTVEDETLLSAYLGEVLEEAGYQVVAAANADEAIEILETRDDIRIIITDINMPGSMDGLRLAAAVKDRWPPIKIIIATGKDAPRRRKRQRIAASAEPMRQTVFSRRSAKSSSFATSGGPGASSPKLSIATCR